MMTNSPPSSPASSPSLSFVASVVGIVVAIASCCLMARPLRALETPAQESNSNSSSQSASESTSESTVQGNADPAANIDFQRDIQPILAEKCLACHGPAEALGDLRLSDPQSPFEPASSGTPAIVRGSAEESELIRRVLSDDPDERMPADAEPLGAKEIDLLRRWINQGAHWSTHWAYEPIQRLMIPAVRQHADRVRNPIDAFVLARLEQLGITPSEEADRITLIRRLHYDLLGLPPAPEHIDAFAHDDSPDAYERLVDRLLSSPHFGERWGRHWLDKARYADSDGYEKDNARPDAYLYRDWVLRALNSDMPMDRFTIEQLAGDMLDEAGDEQYLATAFHRQTLTNTEGGTDPEEFRAAAVVDRTNTTGAIWLGLTVGCANCHTHKYDPITHAEYFGLYAFFNSWDETTRSLSASTAELEKSHEPAAADESESPPQPTLVKARILVERAEPRETRIHLRGNFLALGDTVQPHTPASLHELRPRNKERGPDRLDLARWLMAPSNSLTPRVLTNHLWLQLFGAGLVTTPEDFGARGERPSHPELLDWLAQQYQELGWSRKAMIRLIVNSSTYRQQSHHRPDMVDLDPLNRLLYRQNRFRVEGETIRDMTLAASGLLVPRIGGPSVFPPMPPEIASLSYANNFRWTPSEGEDRYRRGMYTFFKRTAPYPELITFDCPDSNTAALQRRRSNTPLQALTLLNSEVYVEAARAFAARLLREAESDAERLDHAMLLTVGRCPTEEESSRLARLLETARNFYQDHPEEAVKLADGPQTPVAHENVEQSGTDPTELAAWTATARILLNLDEFLTRP